MINVFRILFNISVSASILAAAVIVFRLIFRKAPKWIICLLWGLVGLRLIFPFSLESVIGLLPRSNVITESGAVNTGIAAVDNGITNTAYSIAAAAAPAAPVAASPVPAAAPAAAPTAPAAGLAAGDVVKSPMPGNVLKINVTQGQKVKEGEVLLILEAMKMENEIVSTKAGTVAQIVVSKGAVVETGAPLVVIA